MAESEQKVVTYVLDESELADMLDTEARKRLGMTGDEFLKAYHDGTLPESPAATEIAMLVQLSEDTERRTLPKRLR